MPSAPLAPANTILGQIERQTNDWRVRLAMALGAGLEGGNLGTGPWGVGDQGTSFGAFQIHLPAHPGVTRAQALDPASAVAFMLGEYSQGVSSVSAGLWQSNPQLAAEQAAYRAERPAQDYYVARGAGTVADAYRRAVAGLSGAPLAPGGAPSSPGTGGGSGIVASVGAAVANAVHPVPGASAAHPDPHAPYNPKDLTAPLSAAQKNTIGQYLKDAGGYTDAIIAEYLSTDTTTGGNKDKSLINFYNLVVHGGVYNNKPVVITTNPLIDAAKDALSSLGPPIVTFLENAGMVIFGAVAVIIALYLIAKSSGSSSSSTPAPGAAEPAHPGRRAEGGIEHDARDVAVE